MLLLRQHASWWKREDMQMRRNGQLSAEGDGWLAALPP